MLGMLTVRDNIGILVASCNFSISPGETAHISFFLINLGKKSEQFEFAILGLDGTWFSLSEAQFPLAPGERKRVVVSLHPPRGPQIRAGRHPFSVQFTRLTAPELPLTLHCLLTVAAYSWMSCELDPVDIIAGQSARLRLVNQGNIPQTCRVTFQSESSLIEILPGQLEPQRIPPGESVAVEFLATVRHRKLVRWGDNTPYPGKCPHL